MSRSVLVRNVLALSVIQGANMVLPLVTLPHLLRTLGAEQFGILTFCQSVVAYGILLTEYGFGLTGTQQVARSQRDPGAVSTAFWSVQSAKVMLALGSMVLLQLAVLAVPQFRAHSGVMFACSVEIIATALSGSFLFQGLEKMNLLAVASVLIRALSVPAILFLVRTTDDTETAAWINTGAAMLGALATVLMIWRYRLVHWVAPSMQGVQRALDEGLHVFLSTAAISLYTTTNKVALGFLSGTTSVGIFGAADKIRYAVQRLLGPPSQALYPRITSVMAEDRDAGLRLVSKAMWILGGITFALSVALYVSSPWIVGAVMGPGFEDSIPVLRCLSPLPFVVALSGVFGIQTMLPLGMKREFTRIVVASGLVNLVLLAALAPKFGAMGAAAAVLITETLVTIAMAWALQGRGVSLVLGR
jgi:O-antigen/teichoic acid export membrane protein